MSQDIEIDPDSRTIKYYDSRTEQSIRDFIESGGKVLSRNDAITLLDEIDRLQKDCDHHKQAALDISDENDRLRKENTSLNQSAKSLAHVNHQLQKELFDQNQVMNELFLKAERLEKLVPPETERGPGFVGQGSWSVFAEKVVAERDELRIEVQNLRAWVEVAERAVGERDAAQERVKQHLEEKIELRDELSSLCEEIRILKEENDELREELEQLGNMISAKKELANIHYGHDEFLGIDGYGAFSLKKLNKEEWEVRMLKERVVLYNKKGRRVRAQVVDGNPEGDW